jgi:nucleotide-binding universal stress UspA family protein
MAAKTIYLGTDFSPASERAFDEALAMAKLRGAELVIGHVIPTPGVLGYGVGEVVLAVDTRIREGAENDLEALRRRAERAGVPTQIEILTGSPHDALAAAAEKAHAELIVVGTHGRTGFSRMVMGSVAARLVCTAPCPVLTVRDNAAA